MQGHCYPEHMASVLTSQLNYWSTLSCSVIVVVYFVCAHLRSSNSVLIYIVVIVCITCCGAVYNLCLVLLLYMYFCVCIFLNNNRHMYIMLNYFCNILDLNFILVHYKLLDIWYVLHNYIIVLFYCYWRLYSSPSHSQ